MTNLSILNNDGDIKMKTVVDYKKAGLVFVKGDVVDNSAPNDGSDMKPLSSVMAERCNDGFYEFDLAPIESFAWRTNTGKKPSFNGLIEYVTRDGLTATSPSGCVNFSVRVGGNLVVNKWRPSLNQLSIPTETPEEKEAFDAMSEHKPVFTQEMVDLGQAPLIGMMVKFPTGEGEIALGADNDGVCIVIDGGIYKRVAFNAIKPIDTRTPKQKAIDDLADIIGRNDDPTKCAEAIINAGYKK